MYLRFKPTGAVFCLGKRMITTGWYGVGADIEAFFDRCRSWLDANGYGEIDAFELVFEHEPGWDVRFGEETGHADG
jgi:hypothetical protein